MNSEKPLRLHRGLSKCSRVVWPSLMLLHKRVCFSASSHFPPHVLESCRSTAPLNPRAITQSPYAMHVRARWRDTCHSQISDDSLAWGRWNKIGDVEWKDSGVSPRPTQVLCTLDDVRGRAPLTLYGKSHFALKWHSVGKSNANVAMFHAKQYIKFKKTSYWCGCLYFPELYANYF